MILEAAKRFPNQEILQVDFAYYVDLLVSGKRQSVLILLAIGCILLGIISKIVRSYWLSKEIDVLAHYDKNKRDLLKWLDLSNYGWLWSVGRIFTLFYLLFLGIEICKGGIEWLAQ